MSVARVDGPASGAIRIAAEGELDSAASPRLLDAFWGAVAERGGPSEVTLDLSQITFIDSTGLRALITIEQESVRKELPLSLLAPPESVTELLRTSGVTERITLVGEGMGARSEADFLERLELDFPMRDDAPGLARSAVREALGSVVDEEMLPTLVLMTSELVTNAVRHPSRRDPPIVGLRLVVLADAVRVEVDDPGEGFDPAARIIPDGPIPSPDEGGRGLFVVDRCATRWGSRRANTDRGPRFSVWFEVETA